MSELYYIIIALVVIISLAIAFVFHWKGMNQDSVKDIKMESLRRKLAEKEREHLNQDIVQNTKNKE